jgi:RNase P/RNase MRP subunit p29
MKRQEAFVNHSIYSADRTTHLKIVVVALLAAITVAGVGIMGRVSDDGMQTARVMKAGKPVVLTSNTSMVR